MIDCDIKRILDELEHFGVAASGGSDSMALLTWLEKNYDKSRFEVINVEHGIRGDNSLRDSAFVQQYCDIRGIACTVIHVDAPGFALSEGCSVEQAARILRHEIFAEYNRAHGFCVLTAHHADDQAESIFMHIARGCGINGLRGMSTQDGYLIRPLINIDKTVINRYITDNEIPFVEDETNADSVYNRNFIRNQVIPLIESKYPSFKNNLLRLGNKAKIYDDYAEYYVPELHVDNEGAVSADLRNLHALIAYKTINRACNLLGINVDIEERHYKLIFELQDNECIDLPHALRVYNENGITVFVIIKDKAISKVFDFAIGIYDLGYGKLIIQKESAEGFKQIDSDKIPSKAIIRTRRDGDKIILDYGTKSVGKLLTDKKIPRRLKDFVPIIAADNAVFAVGDIAVAESVKINSNTKKVLNIKWER